MSDINPESGTSHLPEWQQRGIEQTKKMKTDHFRASVGAAKRSLPIPVPTTKPLDLSPEKLPHVAPFHKEHLGPGDWNPKPTQEKG
jgi:hypothetical protein